MKVKLKDIAEHLNISVSTISRVLTGKDRVDEKTRERVLKAIKEFNYQPNEIARSLRYNSSKTIGVIVPDISNQYFTLLIKGIEAASLKNGYLLILCSSNDDEEVEANYLNMLIKKQIDGLIIATVSKDEEYFNRLLNYNIPVVFVDNLPKINRNYNYVSIDNERAGYQLTKHLIDMGYRDICIITGKLFETSAAERLNGWKRAMSEANIKVDNNYINIGDFKKESGYKIMSKMLEDNRKPQAVFAANNHIAYGVLNAIFDKGLRVPEDICVACFDENEKTELLKYKPTAIIQPSEKIGEIAFEIILKRLSNKDYVVFDNIILEPKLTT